MTKPHELQLLSQKHRHILKLSLTALPMINRAHLQVKPTEFDLLSLHINKECLVVILIVLAHDQDAGVFGRRKRQDCLQTDVHLPIADVD